MVVGEITEERDLVIIGGGPGGYTAAIRAAQLGLQVTLVEEGDLGGVCLNRGCIPSKIWTHTSKKISEVPQMQEMGIGVSEPELDLDKLLTYKTKITEQLRTGVESLCQGNKIEVLQGKATFTKEDRIGVEYGHQFDTYIFKHAIIATGSTAVLPEGFPKARSRILLSHELFDLNEVPDHLLIYGHDYLVYEMASTYQSFGSKVTLIQDEELDLDQAIEKELKRSFKKKKIKVIQQDSLQSIEETDEGVTIQLTDQKGKVQSIEGTHLFTSGNPIPNLDSLGINRFGVEQAESGQIVVDHTMKSTASNIYAVGDVTEGPSLAVKAIKQGKVAAEAIAGENVEADLTFLPTIIHTCPPVASVGLTEQEAKENELEYLVGQFNLNANGYAKVTGKTDGTIKVISDAKTEIILGIHMIGEGAVELSSTFVQLLEMAAKVEDIRFPLFAHPSTNEGLLEAVEALTGQAIHNPPQKEQTKIKERSF
ncbi:dihydrolipoyl dehydrogenase [Halalkalibacillus sediminis]|uniref:Dihydrolipoyl dehydrogenase n=1 Tax=Halalkalibacillus sediminis TaxID=2018042 RepID=A0A2I0QSQ1_9BACI|nr:dihydrolipoyl dehydrogenase [Halalkalibacillus sediminis]PKR77372.1 dihydrolipoyl dehydrogenase [Halalkalibacillus sediminis]